MAYNINHYGGSLIATIADGTVDNSLDITLVGKNFAGYGKPQNDNFVFLLENFAGTSPPARPLRGQVWYDSGNRKLKFYDGVKFRTASSAEVSTTEPTGLTTGDFWFDTVNNQLYTYTGTGFTLIGPQLVAGSGATEMLATSVKDSVGDSHSVIQAVNGGNVVFVISSDNEFVLDNTLNEITGFTTVRKGITLAYTNSENPDLEGVTLDDHVFWGTSSNSQRLGGFTPGDFVQSNSGAFGGKVNFSHAGFTVGNPIEILKIFNSAATTPTISNIWGDEIDFTTIVNSVTVTPLVLKGLHILPGANGVTNVGSDSAAFLNVYASSFVGTAREANKLKVGTAYVDASISAVANTVVARSAANETIGGVVVTAGAIKGTYFVGTAITANYADLAEKYLADSVYEVGTVMMIGGENEVTASTWGKRAIGAVSANPAYLMNFELEGGTIVALKGRVPVKVIGRINKGDELIASDNGHAMLAVPHAGRVFAIALGSSDDSGSKLVECLIL